MSKNRIENDISSLSHSKWRCQYHIVFAPKYRRQVIYGKIKEDIGKILIPVTVRGGGYESEWASNCTLGAGTPDEGRNGEAKGFSTAADQVVDEIDQYINKYELEDEIHDGKVVFWVSGFSRAGATANITSKRLVEMYADGSGKLISAKKGKKNFKKKFSVNAKTGKLTVKKKLKKGTYKVKVRVKAAGNKNYKPITKTVTFRVRIK